MQFDYTCFVLCLCLLAGGPSHALSIQSMDVPDLHLSGKQLSLKCEYDLDGSDLMSVEWSLDSVLFFVYNQGQNPPIKSFNVEGISIDVNRSNSTLVYMKSVTWKASGEYTCSVKSIQDGNIEEDTLTKHMTVSYYPKISPIMITGNHSSYAIGDEVNVNCTSSRSYPAARISWRINADIVNPYTISSFPQYQLIQYEPEEDENGLFNSTLNIRFIVTPDYFKFDVLVLHCVGIIGTSRDTIKEVDIVANAIQKGKGNMKWSPQKYAIGHAQTNGAIEGSSSWIHLVILSGMVFSELLPILLLVI